MGDTPHRLSDHTWAEVAEHLKRNARLIIPVGTCEQHGPHLPLATDALIAARLADDLSAEFDLLVAPMVSYGVNIEAEEAYAGTASLRRKTLHRALNDLLAAWEEQGFDEFILLTAHSHDPHLDAVATVVTEHARVRVVDIYSIDLSDLLERQTGPQHAGEVETSLMLYLFPDLVRTDRIRDYPLDPAALQKYLRGRMPRLPRDCDGVFGYPSAASAEKGEAIYHLVLERIRSSLFLRAETES